MRQFCIVFAAMLAAACSEEFKSSPSTTEDNQSRPKGISASYHRPVYSPDGAQIVYMKQDASTEGDWELFIADSDGANARRLTSHPGWDGYASFSPDGRKIAFARNDGEDPKYVVIMDLETGVTVDFSGQDGWLSIAGWMTDGKRLLGSYETDGQRDLVIASLDGTILEKLTDTEHQSEGDAFLSSDEMTIFFSSSGDQQSSAMEQMDMMTRERNILVRSDGGRIYGGALSPDEATISYNDDAPGGDDDDAEIYLYDLTSGDSQQITDNTDWDHQLVWKADGKTALFTSYRTGQERIYKYDVATGDVNPLYPE